MGYFSRRRGSDFSSYPYLRMDNLGTANTEEADRYRPKGTGNIWLYLDFPFGLFRGEPCIWDILYQSRCAVDYGIGLLEEAL